MRLVFYACLMLAGRLPLYGQANGPPAVLTSGLDAYRANGAAAALDLWLKGWPVSEDSTARATLTASLQQVEGIAGRMTGYDVIGSASWGEHTQRVYVVIQFERRPLYARFDAYDSGRGWRLVNLTWNAEPQDVFPPEMLMPAWQKSPS
jgi:hypothetical protein